MLSDCTPPPPLHPRLFDERSRPDFREVYGDLMSQATHLDVALTHIRLSTLDLRPREVESVRSIRLLLAEVNAVHLEAEAYGIMLRSERIDVLRTFADHLANGRAEIRSAPLGGWSPDFSIFRGPSGPLAVLIGFHWFERPFPHRGPAFASLHGAEAARAALLRYEEIWGRAHDISPALLGILERAGVAESPSPTRFPEPSAVSIQG
jgi:hypothetical protein